MEVSRRRIIQKHLEPARPLRRCAHGNFEPSISPVPCGQSLVDIVCQETNIDVAQLYNIINLPKNKEKVQKKVQEGRISYTREFLIGLASCPASRKRPELLPDHPIVLQNARAPEKLWLV